MLVDQIQEITNSFNANEPDGFKDIWTFVHGPKEWQNLGDYAEDSELPFEQRKKYLMLWWSGREILLTNDNIASVLGYRFTGELVLSLRSKISDKDYGYKYSTHIKGLYTVSERVLNEFNECLGYTVKKWLETEVTDTFDTNMDGLKINFTIEFNY